VVLRKLAIWIAMIGMIIIGIFQWFFATARGPISNETTQTVITIATGTSVSALGKQLHQAGLLDSPFVFSGVVRISGNGNHIRAGDFRIDTRWNYEELIEHLSKDPEVQYSITLIEGMRTQDVIKLVQNNPKIKRDFADQDMESVRKLLNLPLIPEGAFLPDTYFIRAGSTESDLYLRANKALQDFFKREWSKRQANLPFKNPMEALIAASIVEKETGKPEERPLIAAVVINRLNKGMPLQMDPTVIYGLGNRFDGNIRKKDLSDPSPYNTYTHKGLPPTPIALASAESLYAVLHPATSNALYFVAKGNGTHYFSDNLEAHNAAVQQYQLHGKSQ
jgi:UPF0755 protein